MILMFTDMVVCQKLDTVLIHLHHLILLRSSRSCYLDFYQIIVGIDQLVDIDFKSARPTGGSCAMLSLTIRRRDTRLQINKHHNKYIKLRVSSL
jgi:hypothetical protein